LKKFVVALSVILMYSSPAAGQQPGGEGMTFDFHQADIRHVITALAEAGGFNVVFGGLPNRPVTLRTNAPLTQEEILPLLRNLVESNGLRLVEEGAVLRIEAGQPGPVRPQTASLPATGDQRLYVYRLSHARAVRLAATIQALFGGAAPVSSATLSRTGLTHELRAQQVPPLDPAAVGGPVAPATPERQLRADIEGQVQVVPDELTNSLLVRANERDWAVIREAIQALDLRPLQVLIEVVIAEVRRSTALDLGVSTRVEGVRDRRTGGLIDGRLEGPSTGDLVLQIMELGPVSAEVVLSAMASRADVSIVSRPVILAQNNQEARILVGSQRPFVQVFRALPTDAAVRDQVVQYREVGTSLTIRPTINQDGYVSLDLIQEVSTATTEIQFGAPVISTREASTQLLVRDRQTVVIGGLMDQQRDRVRRGIPLLKDIPLIGALFGRTDNRRIQTELFLFLTPHVIREDGDSDRLLEGVEEGSPLLRRLPRARTIIPGQPESSPDER
jgi:general secretion pathway protein D